MRLDTWTRRFSIAAFFAVMVSLNTAPASAEQFENPPILPAQMLAPPGLLVGDGFHVEPQVPTDGLMAHFTIVSDVGTFPAYSDEMLRVRVAEIPAIVQLNNTSKSKVFADALAANAAKPVQAAGQIVMHPVDTIQGLPEGVGVFGRVGVASDQVQEAATQPDGNLAATTGQATRVAFGYEQERRALAKKLGVDPYTTNPVLSKQLDDFALVAFRAHVGVTTTMAVFIPGSMAITATRIVSQWVWDTPKADLILKNQNSLAALGVPNATISRFTNNQQFPLSVQVAFVEYLDLLPGVPGRADAVALASTAQSEVQARFLTDSVGMLVNYNNTQAPLARLLVHRAIIAQDSNGAIVVEAPADYVSWTDDISNFANRQDFQGHRGVLAVTGQLSPLAKRNFTEIGWMVAEHGNPIPVSDAGM